MLWEIRNVSEARIVATQFCLAKLRGFSAYQFYWKDILGLSQVWVFKCPDTTARVCLKASCHNFSPGTLKLLRNRVTLVLSPQPVPHGLLLTGQKRNLKVEFKESITFVRTHLFSRGKKSRGKWTFQLPFCYVRLLRYKKVFFFSLVAYLDLNAQPVKCIKSYFGPQNKKTKNKLHPYSWKYWSPSNLDGQKNEEPIHYLNKQLFTLDVC